MITDNIVEASLGDGSVSRCFFIDGPGGTGKSFLFHVMHSKLTLMGKIVKNIASTGIAATLLENGMTAHKAFALSVPLDSDSDSRIDASSLKGFQLAQVDVFFTKRRCSPVTTLNVSTVNYVNYARI